MNLAEFEKALTAHDWFYSFSDDSRVWKAGEANYDRLHKLAAEGPVEFRRAFNAAYARNFHREPFPPPYNKFPFTLP